MCGKTLINQYGPKQGCCPLQALSFSALLTNCNVATCWHVELCTLSLLHLSYNIHSINMFSSVALSSSFISKKCLGWQWVNLGCCLRNHRKTLMSTGRLNSPKTKMINGVMLGLSMSICAGPSLKMQPRNNWLNCRARCMDSEPPKSRRLHASGILRVRIWKG